MESKIIIGRHDLMDLPEFDINLLDVKIDTGAYGSSLHCHHMEIVSRNGEEYLQFQLLDPKHAEFVGKYYYSRQFGYKIVKSSNGSMEKRYTITTDIIIFNKTFEVEFSLTDRSDMKFPALLGRTFLKNRFLVDVSKKNISAKQNKNK